MDEVARLTCVRFRQDSAEFTLIGKQERPETAGQQHVMYWQLVQANF
jgi:hypothetical protein